MEPIQRSEYVVKVSDSDGGCFVSNAYQADIDEAIKVYFREKHSLINRTKNSKVWIEKHRIETTIEDFTDQAEKILENRG